MIQLGEKIVKFKTPILIVALLLLIPSVLGMMNTRINYDMLTYLPSHIDTVKGQDILLDEFGKGAFSLIMVEDMKPKEVAVLKQKIAAVDHVETVLWYDDVLDITVPIEMLPQKYYDAFNRENATMLAVFFDSATSADETMDAIKEIRKVSGKQCFVAGMSALVTDLKDLAEKEEPVYVGLAVLFACIAMMVFMDSFLIPFIFLFSIGIAILINLGSNFFLGEVSYITKALSAVLQLAVTMDYSIFLWHSYHEERLKFDQDKNTAMAHAITNTLSAVLGSAITTVAGFIALCFMSFTLGKDLGIVMAKGVLFGVLGCITTLPALILIFDGPIEKTRHRPLLRNMAPLSKKIVGHYKIWIVLFIIILVPALYGYIHTQVYYDLGSELPKHIDYVKANQKLHEEFDMASTHMILADANMPVKTSKEMIAKLEEVDGVKYVLGLDRYLGASIPKEILPKEIKNSFESDKYKLLVIGSSYRVASDKVNNQIDALNTVLKAYDKNGMLLGEAPCTKDLIHITDRDFKVVSIISIFAILIIIAIVLKSLSLPFILVMVIEFAICINLGIPYYRNLSLAFVAPICISTIQLGATVDYAILMTTRYRRERTLGKEKREAAEIALSYAMPSIIVSAVGFFSATFGVSLYSNLDIIKSMCGLMARGAIVSMLSVLIVLPALFMVFDKLITKTSKAFKFRY